jgi:hypothetical protein
MKLITAISESSTLAYEEDENQVIGKIPGEGWAIANSEDVGRQARMVQPTFTVTSNGLNAAEVMEAMELAGINGDQDWQNEMTNYVFEDCVLKVSGHWVEVDEIAF